MGGCLSCRSSNTCNSIRVVHVNGYVEEFAHPVWVSQLITCKPSGRFVCTPVELLSNRTRPMKPDALLELGQIYFLLPYSTLQADVSPVDLVSLARKLTAIAKSKRCETKSSRTGPLILGACADGVQRSYGVRSWKPILDTIREKSFTRRSESDLQEMHLETFK
ncbi:DUF4228 domain-containing protein, partial [Cephalotus follicularis]